MTDVGKEPADSDLPHFSPEHDDDGLDLFPIDAVGAIVEEGAKMGGLRAETYVEQPGHGQGISVARSLLAVSSAKNRTSVETMQLGALLVLLLGGARRTDGLITDAFEETGALHKGRARRILREQACQDLHVVREGVRLRVNRGAAVSKGR